MPALSIVEGPTLSIVEGPALSVVEGPALTFWMAGPTCTDTLGHGVRECPVAQMPHRRPTLFEVVNIEQSQPPPSA